MDKLSLELKKHFQNEFDFLKLFEVVYDKNNNMCKVVFLYPQHIDEITQTQRDKIEKFLYEFLSLNAKIDLKFKKSFLDEHLIKDFIINYFKRNNFSLFTHISQENIKIKEELAEINVTLNFEKEIYSYIEENSILLDLKTEIEKNFIATFSFFLAEGESQIDESILEKRNQELKPKPEKKVPRYIVEDVEKIFGKEIKYLAPEFIKNQQTEKESVILAGEISNINKKAYKSKHSKDPNEESFFYTFDIYDTTGTMPAIHFASKSTMPKLETFTNGMQMLFLGDIKKNIFGKLTYFIKTAYHCVINKQSIKDAQAEYEKEQFLALDTYQTIFPKKFIDTHQENFFFKPQYNNLIKNNTIVVFDVETTGLEPEFAEIIEIGAVKVVDGELVETFQTLVKPKKEIPDLITEITGINNEMVKDAPSIFEAMTDFILFSKGSLLSGYNVGFDMRFIQKAASDIGFHFTNRVEDTMYYARQSLTLGNYTLKNVAKALNISLKEAHRALNDAIATARVLIALNTLN
ncbi:MAG: PolC-type DNA polymerase III [Christensenellales bacterium]|jgi:DNA polymerase III epsilon subunit family exonuclease